MNETGHPQAGPINKGDDSLLTGMGNTVALSHTSDKTNRTAVPTVATTTATKESLISEITTNTPKRTPMIAELETDLDSGLVKLMERTDMQEVLEADTLNQTVLKSILQTILHPGTSADDEPGKAP